MRGRAAPGAAMIRSIDWRSGSEPSGLVSREWLVTNGLGGYASGTVANIITRRYHGLLIAALPNPLGRVVLLNHLWERVRVGDTRVSLDDDASSVLDSF